MLVTHIIEKERDIFRSDVWLYGWDESEESNLSIIAMSSKYMHQLFSLERRDKRLSIWYGSMTKWVPIYSKKVIGSNSLTLLWVWVCHTWFYKCGLPSCVIWCYYIRTWSLSSAHRGKVAAAILHILKKKEIREYPLSMIQIWLSKGLLECIVVSIRWQWRKVEFGVKYEYGLKEKEKKKKRCRKNCVNGPLAKFVMSSATSNWL